MNTNQQKKTRIIRIKKRKEECCICCADNVDLISPKSYDRSLCDDKACRNCWIETGKRNPVCPFCRMDLRKWMTNFLKVKVETKQKYDPDSVPFLEDDFNDPDDNLTTSLANITDRLLAFANNLSTGNVFDGENMFRIVSVTPGGNRRRPLSSSEMNNIIPNRRIQSVESPDRNEIRFVEANPFSYGVINSEGMFECCCGITCSLTNVFLHTREFDHESLIEEIR